MGSSKWPEVKEKLVLVEAWCRNGLINEQIAHNLGINVDTLYTYKKEHPEFSEALTRGKEIIDVEVENSLLKRAKGYKYVETTKEMVMDAETGKHSLVVTKTVTKEVNPDTTAQIYWLNNRKPKEWRNKQEIEHSGETTVNNKRDLSGYSLDQLKDLLKNE